MQICADNIIILFFAASSFFLVYLNVLTDMWFILYNLTIHWFPKGNFKTGKKWDRDGKKGITLGNADRDRERKKIKQANNCIWNKIHVQFEPRYLCNDAVINKHTGAKSSKRIIVSGISFQIFQVKNWEIGKYLANLMN